MSIRTVKALEKSFKQLLAKKPISKITVKEITDGSGVSRMTFYYHFESVYDLARYVSEQESLKNEKASNDDKSVLISIFNTFYADKLATFNIYDSLNKAKASSYLNKTFEKVISSIVTKRTENKRLNNVSVEFVYDYCLSAVVGVADKWLNNKMNVEATTIGESLYDLTISLINSLVVEEGI